VGLCRAAVPHGGNIDNAHDLDPGLRNERAARPERRGRSSVDRSGSEFRRHGGKRDADFNRERCARYV
jgi:hypothetical protein